MTEPTTEELLAEARARLADIAMGARMMLQVVTGSQAHYAREVLRVASACLDPKCGDEGRLCDECFEREARNHEYLRGVPRHQVINDQRSREEYAQELRDAGRDHLVNAFGDNPAELDPEHFHGEVPECKP